MSKKAPSFKEILDAAARSVPDLWSSDGGLVLSRVAEYFKKKGHPVSQPTLHRHYTGDRERPRKLDSRVVEAFYAVFRVPRSMLRGEPMSADTERAVVQWGLDVFLLAQKIAELPSPTRDLINRQIEDLLQREAELKKAYESAGVVPISRRSPS
jgi:hypothetical protein